MVTANTLYDLRGRKVFDRVGTHSCGEGEYFLAKSRKGGMFYEGSVTVVRRSVIPGEFARVTYHVLDGEISSVCSIEGHNFSPRMIRAFRTGLRGKR